MRRIQSLALLTGTLLLLGCGASRPEQELADARAALESARTAEADLYSADAYEQAAESLRAAEAEIAAQGQSSPAPRSYDRAKELLLEARRQADNARAMAAANRESVKAEAATAQTEARAAVDAAEALLSSAPERKGMKTDLEALRSDLEAAEISLAEAGTSYTSGRYMDALNQCRAVKEKAETVSADIQQAGRKKGRTI